MEISKEIIAMSKLLWFQAMMKELGYEPIRHGKWIVDEDGNIECSECGCHGIGDNYCERCGAKMDGVEERLAMPKADGSTLPKDYMAR